MLNDMTDIPVREVGNPLRRRRRGSSGLLLVAADSFSARRIMISLFVVLVMLGIVAGCAAPAAPAPVAGPLAGDWHGSIEVPDQPLDIGVHLTGEESLAGTIDVPAMGVIAAPLAEVQRDGDRVGFTIPDVPGAPAFSGTLRIDALVGDFTQAGQSFPVTLTRGALAGAARPQEPHPPFPYRTEDVTYHDGEVQLAGTLTLPAGPGPFTAVLLVSGSGPQDRDEALLGHKPFLVLSDTLTQAGYAVLRVDDRGVGGSTGDLNGSDYEDLTGDITAGVDFLRARPDITRVGLLGHSEGGYLAPLAAQRDGDVAFVVLMAGPAVPGDQVLEAQNRLMLAAAGQTPAQIEARIATIREGVGLLRAEDYAGAATLVRTALTSQGVPADQVDGQVTELTSRYFRSFAVYDPAAALAALTVPVLAVYGGRDVQVPAEQSVPAMQALLGRNPDVTVRTFPDLNHLMQPAATGQLAEYATIATTLAPEFLDLVTGWMHERFPAT